jgi:competence protein ComEC
MPDLETEASQEATPTVAALAPGKDRGPTVPLWSLLLPVVATALMLLIAGQQPDGRLHLWVLDVGQGDSILLRTPKGHTALIDGGPGATPVLNGIGKHLPFWQRDLDLIVLTHPQQDHIMGLVELLERNPAHQVVQTEFTATAGVQGEWLRVVRDRSVPVHYARRGDTISFEEEPEIILRVLNPAAPDGSLEKQADNVNNTSIVLQLSYGPHDILLEGDAEWQAENEMVRYASAGLASEILKVGHHGSKTSSSTKFLAAVRPQVAIISVGAENRFGHPSPQTIQALQNEGARIYRTDLNGTVEIIADQNTMWVRSER